ncbi:PAS domain S-box protein [Krasilnikovia sp. MM14-A1004]|uniref:hybrid sensor histidine kinase/response regulator n=1 Tax=Krasilnikovia sp. MM14-A1004 TaxID=3373541 RepID=UPI00399CD663
MPIGARLGAVFGFVALLLIIMIGVAVDNILAQRTADQAVAESAALQRDALTAKFRTADFNGWQTGYAFDTVRGVPNAAADEVGQRRAFLASTAAFRQDLARIGAHPLDTTERRLLTTAENAFNRFMEVDARIVSAYRSGDPTAIAAANDLVAGEAMYWFDGAADAVDRLASRAKASADADAAMARHTSARALTILIAVGVVCVLLAVVLALLATRAVAETARNKAMLAAIVEQSADATLALTLDGTISAWNSGAERIYGYTRREAVGRSIAMVMRPDRKAALALALAGLSEGRQLHLDEAVRRRKDGSEVIVSTVLWPLRDGRGVVIGGAATERDITARKQREAEQKLSDERAARTARLESLGQLAGGVAHDFNNLLAIILNCAEFIADEPRDQVTADLARIHDAAQRAKTLTGQLLLFAKQEPTLVETVDLNEVVIDATELLSRTVGANIRLRCHTCAGTVPVNANRGLLDQILLNLVINARDAMPDGGVVDITTDFAGLPDVPAQSLPAGRYARLTVSDTGIGMTPEVKDRLFEPFFTTKPGHQGTGLGLATVYGIVGDAGGMITVDSTPGAGTTFRILLPIAAPASDTTADTPHTPAPGHGERVLVIEDEDTVRDVVVRILTHHGYRTTAVRDADSALRVDLDDVALLITDMILPDLSGPAVVAELHARRPDLPVLFMTGHSDPSARPVHGVGAAARIVYKPFTAAELLIEVGDTLGATAGHARSPSAAGG